MTGNKWQEFVVYILPVFLLLHIRNCYIIKVYFLVINAYREATWDTRCIAENNMHYSAKLIFQFV